MKTRRTANVIKFPSPRKRPPLENVEEVYEEYSSHAILLAASWYVLTEEINKVDNLLNHFVQSGYDHWTWLPDDLATLVEEAEDHFFEAYLGKPFDSKDSSESDDD